ncbi:MAG: LuxR C-terminal-related transcriptional regulator [Cyanobacteria bacterium P01_F01_bin.153]
MPSVVKQDLDLSRLLLDLKRCAEVINGCTGLLEPEVIATHVTDSLVATFDCTFARVWLIESDRRGLKLVASSGLYTRLDGSFARVPMGHFKIGKIAQNCIPFLSNCLPEEEWVKDREWAIANQIQGFAGLPLIVGDQAIGVLAIFSIRPMNPEFLEVLQMLSLSVAGSLSCALNHQQLIAKYGNQYLSEQPIKLLSEQLSTLLGRQKLSLLGTEQPLAPRVHQLMVDAAHHLADCSCQYGRLVYEDDVVVLEAVLAVKESNTFLQLDPRFKAITTAAQTLGGTLIVQDNENHTVISVQLQLPKQEIVVMATAEDSMEESESPLSEREHEVMELLAHGLRDRDIAEKLYISVRTVKFHAKNVLTKLQVNTRIQAVFEATKRGWLT